MHQGAGPGLPQRKLGEKGDGKQGTDGTAFQCVNFIIALQGIYPSRSLRQYGGRRDQRRPPPTEASFTGVSK